MVRPIEVEKEKNLPPGLIYAVLFSHSLSLSPLLPIMIIPAVIYIVGKLSLLFVHALVDFCRCVTFTLSVSCKYHNVLLFVDNHQLLPSSLGSIFASPGCRWLRFQN